MSTRLPFRASLALTVLPSLSVAADAAFQRLISLGDSLSDVGNVYTLSSGSIPESPPYYQGRFSNGPVWVEGLATGLGLPPLAPSLGGGTNYAHGGAVVGPGYSFGLVPNTSVQVDLLLGGIALGPTDLVTYLAGANSVLNGEPPSSVVSGIIDDLSRVAAAGVRSFSVANLPPLGLTPYYFGTPDEPIYNAASVAFNQALDAALDVFAVQYAVTVHRADVYGLFEDIIADPAAFGFTNLTEPALVDDVPAPNPDSYLFWDNIHPTRVAHALLAERALSSIPEPTSAVMWGALLAGVCCCRRRSV